MASGILGQSAPSAATNTTVYTVPSSGVSTSTFNISVCNMFATPATISIAIAATGTPSTSEWIEFNTIIPPNTTFERTGIVSQSTKNVVVFASDAVFAVTVYGFEAT